jgi:uncharacterized protein with NRDE domain
VCTVALIHGLHPEVPLIVAANRDELLARPWGPPTWVGGDPSIVAGIDLEKGGTWMGRHATRLLRRADQRARAAAGQTLARRHRGRPPLRAGSAAGASSMLEGLDARDFSPFNLLYGEAGAVRVAYGRQEDARVAIDDVARGVRVLPNGPLDAPEIAKVARMRSLIEPHAARPLTELRAELARALADHEAPGNDALHAICVHLPQYGTSSSTILALTEGRTLGYWFAAGPPCRAGFEEVTGLLRG